MAIAKDASSPAALTGTTTGALTTASFTPPAGSLIVATCVTGNSSGSGVQSGTISDSLSGTWTTDKTANTSGQGASFVVRRTTAVTNTAMTVKWTPSGTAGKGANLVVYVLTGAAGSPLGATASTTSGTTGGISITPTAAGNYVVGVLAYTNTSTTLTILANSTADKSTADATNGETYGNYHLTALTANTSPVTVGYSNSALSSVQHCAVEYKAGSNTPTASLSDTVGVTDAIVGTLIFARSLSDTAGVTDSVSSRTVFARAASESVGVTDSLATHSVRVRAQADTVGVTDSVVGKVALTRGASDTVGVTDALATHLALPRAAAETVGISDGLTTHSVRARNVADTVGVTDTAVSRLVLLRSLAETVGVTDSLSTSGAKNLTASLADTVGVTDSLARLLVFRRALSDTVGTSDTVTCRIAMLRAVADAVGITDSLSGHRLVFLRSVADTVGVTDSLGIGAQHQSAAFSDTAGTSDTLAIRITLKLSAAETFGITDSLSVSSHTAPLADRNPWKPSAHEHALLVAIEDSLHSANEHSALAIEHDAFEAKEFV